MEPIQLQVPLAQYTYNKALDFVAARVSEIFNAHGKKHVFFGGYAVTVLGGSRMTNDVDIITGDTAMSMRELLLSADDRFFMTTDNKLNFKTGTPGTLEETSTAIELLQGGIDRPLKLPDANTAPFLILNPKDAAEERPDCEIRILHPGLLFLTKMK